MLQLKPPKQLQLPRKVDIYACCKTLHGRVCEFCAIVYDRKSKILRAPETTHYLLTSANMLFRRCCGARTIALRHFVKVFQ